MEIVSLIVGLVATAVDALLGMKTPPPKPPPAAISRPLDQGLDGANHPADDRPAEATKDVPDAGER